ncbi:MAG TPA: bifunctional methylenetetrahydrofolate dehydrogenase/methenyltetrahydrofolate cyclohydrolase FolD [Nitrococcus sp.]|nr:bifunctional methylenetetrahydrofolate dehydrogenase/methenyltetrahydrofolate cyclohydrolase FolD [Nitrococcus sp.]
MSARIIDGKSIAAATRRRIADAVRQRIATGHRRPGLAVIQVGDNPASTIYVRLKRQDCSEVGFHSEAYKLPTETSQAQLLNLVDRLNSDPAIDGILVQVPLPGQLEAQTVIERIAVDKDVDGFHPENLGRLLLRLPGMHPCTPYGVMTLLRHTGEPLEGKDAVVIGQSSIVGRPMAIELLNARCTPTICHSRTRDLQAKVRGADVVVVAVGRERFIPGDWIKAGAIVIDIGINRNAAGHLVGDVDFATACERAAWITPVPGGVGPMTRAALLENTLLAAERHDSQI